MPSAGAHTNPQLFHDAVGPSSNSNSKKRKRGGSKVAQEEKQDAAGEASDEEESDTSALDFFAPRDGAKAAEASSTKKESKKQHKKSQSSAPSKTVTLLDEDECRRILRSHRLKLTLLTDKKAAKAAEEEEKKKKKKKSSKKSKKAEEVKDKDDKVQVFPQPLTAFSQLRHTYGISPRLADNLDRLLYRIPTEVQMGSLPLLLDPELALRHATTLPPGTGVGKEAGVDFMAVAPTGSGKTLSFLIPSINSVLKRRADEKASSSEPEPAQREEHVLHTVVVAPTRELARQIANEGKKLAVGTGVRIVAMSKGMRVQAEGGEDDAEEAGSDAEDSEDSAEEDDDKDKEQAETGKATVTKADILVTTPMLLLNFLSAGSKTLPTVRTLVLDEADVLLDPLFREQTQGLWNACTHADLQTSFWSATMASSVEELAAEQLGARQQQQQQQRRLLVRLVVGLKDTAVPNVTHRLVYTATEQGKLLAMRQLLHPSTSVSVTSAGTSRPDQTEALRPPFLVFAQTAERATALHDELRYDIPATAGGADRLGVLHAALSDGARAAVVRRFRAGEVWVLITTDVLARGIDFAGVNGVVNYDVPGSAAAYVHRAGRTGRAGRQGGLAVTLYTKEDIPFVKSVANVIAASEKQAGKTLGENDGSGMPQWLLDALPKVAKADKKRLKTQGVASRRAGGGKGSAQITSKSAWERRKENNRRDAIASSKRRKREAAAEADTEAEGEEWAGLD